MIIAFIMSDATHGKILFQTKAHVLHNADATWRLHLNLLSLSEENIGSSIESNGLSIAGEVGPLRLCSEKMREKKLESRRNKGRNRKNIILSN